MYDEDYGWDDLDEVLSWIEHLDEHKSLRKKVITDD